jgi:hypothetical protein
MVPGDPLKLAMLRLKRAAPAEYQEFLNVFGAYTDDVTVAVTDAPSDEILVMQGRAQQCRSLFRAFETCEQALVRPQPRPTA